MSVLRLPWRAAGGLATAATGAARAVAAPVLAPVLAPVGQVARDHIVRTCPVPGDLDAVTSVGDEADDPDGIDVEPVWTRARALYASGVHPALQLCIRHRGEIVVDRAIGYARGVRPGRPIDPATAIPATTHTPINLFSAGKAVTALVMCLLEEHGHVALDEPVATYLPAFACHGKERITVRQVLTHRAGVPALPDHALDLDLLADPDVVRDLLCDLRPSAVIGGPPAYHALTGGFIAEAVARATTGRSLRDLLVDHVKAPLGLLWFDFGVGDDDAALVATNVCSGLPIVPPLSFVFDRLLGMPWDEAVRWSNDARFVTSVVPSGNVIVTARDTATFYQCLLDGGVLDGTRVMSSATIDRARRADLPTIDLDRRILLPLQYGTGFMLGTSTISLYGWNHPRAFGHLGLANSFTWADPDRDLVVALLTTGKAVLGTHVGALLALIAQIHRTFPVATTAR